MPAAFASLEAYFEARTERGPGENPCLVWTGTHDAAGYGRMKQGRKQRIAHRVAWEMANGPIPDGMYICHHCDNPPCVDVSHLFLGTPADNMHDMDRKGRRVAVGLKGSANRTAKLSEPDVVVIRERSKTGEGARRLAAAFGVSRSAIRFVVSGRSWTHV